MESHAHSHEVDDPSRISDIRSTIDRKRALREFYLDVYREYAACLARCPSEGTVLELGSGGSFVKDVIPEVVTSDTLPYAGVDRVIDATRMEFEAGALRAIFMMNVFHHIADVEAFLREATRCLRPGGRILIFDQHPGIVSTPILKHAHGEPWRPEATEWSFETTGPLSGANGALAWIVFRRDRARFEQLFPSLRLLRYEPTAPLAYWLAGGLKGWSLVPGWATGIVKGVDRALVSLVPNLGSFVKIEIERV